MAKKKTTKKKTAKKKTKKKVKKKRTSKKKTGVAKAKNQLAKLAGLTKCHLCDKKVESLEALEEHLYADHSGFTIKEYKKMYPASFKAHRLPNRTVSTDEVYRAMTHMAKYGKYPEWFDASKQIDITSADNELLRVFASVIIDSHQERVMDIIRYVNVALKRKYDPADAATTSIALANQRANEGMGLIRETMDIMHRAADLLTKTDKIKSPVARGVTSTTFVAAATIENADNPEVDTSAKDVRRKMTAMTSELHGLVQSFVTEGGEHGDTPPSQAEKDKEVAAEVVDTLKSKPKVTDV